LNLLYFYISTFRSICAVPNMAVFCSSLTSCFPGTLLTYFLTDFEIVPVALLLLVSPLFLIPLLLLLLLWAVPTTKLELNYFSEWTLDISLPALSLIFHNATDCVIWNVSRHLLPSEDDIRNAWSDSTLCHVPSLWVA